MSLRVRVIIEQLIAAVTGLLGLVTIFWKDWIEGIFGWDPDHHSGSVEVGIIVGLLVLSAVAFVISRVDKRRLEISVAGS